METNYSNLPNYTVNGYLNQTNYKMDVKSTLKLLHENFPDMTLDELFKILDCIVIENNLWYSYTSPTYDTISTYCKCRDNKTTKGTTYC